MQDLLDLHRSYLSDTPRLDAFRAAIKMLVRSGDVVADLGAGTGILSLFACEAGAARVYAIERDAASVLGRKIVAANGFDNRVVFIRGDAREITLPERADVIVSDLAGHFGFESGLFTVMADARARHLKPDGRLTPSRISLHIAAAQDEQLREDITFWTRRPAGFDMTAAWQYARNRAYYTTTTSKSLVSTIASTGDYATGVTAEPQIALESSVRVTRNGWIDGLIGWFRAELAPGVVVTNAPDDLSRLDRLNLLLPVAPPIPVTAGQEIAVRLRVLTADRVFSWSLRPLGDRGEECTVSASTFEGLLLSKENLAAFRDGNA